MRTFDIVIPLGNGSNWANNELRFALRSVDKYIPHAGNVFIIGQRPEWIRNVTHIFYPDRPGTEWREFNIMQKVLKACALPQLSREFIFMNDDHFLLDPLPPLPFYYCDNLEGKLAARKNRDHYWNSLNNTLYVLNGRKYPTHYYDIHAPIIYDKNLFADVVLSYDWLAHPFGYVIKSLYCNTLGVSGTIYPDLKIKDRLNCFELEKKIDKRKFFSIADEGITQDLEIFLRYLYPTKSKYEL